MSTLADYLSPVLPYRRLAPQRHHGTPQADEPRHDDRTPPALATSRLPGRAPTAPPAADYSTGTQSIRVTPTSRAVRPPLYLPGIDWPTGSMTTRGDRPTQDSRSVHTTSRLCTPDHASTRRRLRASRIRTPRQAVRHRPATQPPEIDTRTGQNPSQVVPVPTDNTSQLPPSQYPTVCTDELAASEAGLNDAPWPQKLSRHRSTIQMRTPHSRPQRQADSEPATRNRLHPSKHANRTPRSTGRPALRGHAETCFTEPHRLLIAGHHWTQRHHATHPPNAHRLATVPPGLYGLSRLLH